MPKHSLTLSKELRHFLQLTTSEYGTSEAVAALELADCVINNVPCLDETALRGLCEFIGISKVAPQQAIELLDSH